MKNSKVRKYFIAFRIGLVFASFFAVLSLMFSIVGNNENSDKALTMAIVSAVVYGVVSLLMLVHDSIEV